MDKIEKTKSFFNKGKREGRDVISPTQEFVFRLTCESIPRTEATTYAMDVGCNRGRYTRYLSRRFTKVWGIDYAEITLQFAEKADNIEYVCLDVEKNGARLCELFPRMDLVTTISVFEMVQRPSDLAHNLFEVVRPGGRVFVLIPNRFSLNYAILRAILWAGRTFLRRSWYIYNNGITPRLLKKYLQEAEFEIAQEGMIIGLPVYLLERLPYAVQSFFLGMDFLFKPIFRGGYYWVSARKGHERMKK
jgi:2-polyprenyl-3-methyl-5-hydroxy-6-metoxy-1,4-benzoquinol methylase